MTPRGEASRGAEPPNPTREAGKGSKAPAGAEHGEGSWRTREERRSGREAHDKAARGEGLRGGQGQAGLQQLRAGVTRTRSLGLLLKSDAERIPVN